MKKARLFFALATILLTTGPAIWTSPTAQAVGTTEEFTTHLVGGQETPGPGTLTGAGPALSNPKPGSPPPLDCMQPCGSAWDSAIGSPGIDGGVDGGVNAIAVSDANGYVYVGGRFSLAGGISAPNIARWNGSSWSALGSG